MANGVLKDIAKGLGIGAQGLVDKAQRKLEQEKLGEDFSRKQKALQMQLYSQVLGAPDKYDKATVDIAKNGMQQLMGENYQQAGQPMGAPEIPVPRELTQLEQMKNIFGGSGLADIAQTMLKEPTPAKPTIVTDMLENERKLIDEKTNPTSTDLQRKKDVNKLLLRIQSGDMPSFDEIDKLIGTGRGRKQTTLGSGDGREPITMNLLKRQYDNLNIIERAVGKPVSSRNAADIMIMQDAGIDPSQEADPALLKRIGDQRIKVFNLLKKSEGGQAPSQQEINDVLQSVYYQEPKPEAQVDFNTPQLWQMIAGTANSGGLSDVASKVQKPAVPQSIVDEATKYVERHRDRPIAQVADTLDAYLKRRYNTSITEIDSPKVNIYKNALMKQQGSSREKARQILEQNGKDASESSIDIFLKNNPGFK